MSSLVMDLVMYSVGFTGVDYGKCCESKYSSVSAPGSVIVPSAFSNVPKVLSDIYVVYPASQPVLI